MAETRPTEETPFEAVLRSAIMQSGRTFDDLERTSKVSSQAIGRFVSGTRGLTSWSAGRLMESLNLVLLCREAHEKLGKRTVVYSRIEIEERPAPRPRGRPMKIPHHGSRPKEHEAASRHLERQGQEDVTDEGGRHAFKVVIVSEPVTAQEFKENPSKKRGRPPKAMKG